MPRFAVLAHDWPEAHLDLFLEAGSELQAWKLPADFSPLLVASVVPNAAHRLLYLDFEGEVPGGRGSVLRWDAGEFRWIAEGRAEFAGGRLKGSYEWIRSASGAWTFGRIT